MVMIPSNRTATGGTYAPTRTAENNEPDQSVISTKKPQIAPADTPAAPLPLATPPAPAAPAPAPAPAPTAPPSAPRTDSDTSTRGDAPPSAPTAPTAPSPYQTNDPMAFMPISEGFGLTPQATPPAVTQTTPMAKPMTVPAPLQAPTPAGADPLHPTAGLELAPQSTSNGAVNLNPTTPNNSLTNYTISPGQLADRFGIAKDKIADWNTLEEPIFNRTIQNISQNRAGAGQLGSGMVRGAFADAAKDYNTQRLAAERGFLNDALGGSIDDVFKSVGIAQQQQGFQAGQQQQGFNNQVTLQQLQDSEAGQQWSQLMQSMGFNADQMQRAWDNAYKAQQLSDDETGQAFNRAMQQALFGAQGDPAQILEWLAGLYALPQGFNSVGA